jgi:hypothetical protein
MVVHIADPKYIKGSPRPREAQRNIGPWRVLKRLLHGPYILVDQTGERRVVPIDQIVFSRAQIKAFADKADKEDKEEKDAEEFGKDIYEVDRILKDRMNAKTGQREFLIRWKGYDDSEDTWEPRSHINGSAVLRKYEKEKKLAIGKRAAVKSFRTGEVDLRWWSCADRVFR